MKSSKIFGGFIFLCYLCNTIKEQHKTTALWERDYIQQLSMK